MGNEPYKWQLNPEATLRELDRMEEDPGYLKTICGVHRKIWAYLNVTMAERITKEDLQVLNFHLETAYTMGKRMDYRLRRYHAARGGIAIDEVEPTIDGRVSEQLMAEVDCPPPESKDKVKR